MRALSDRARVLLETLGRQDLRKVMDPLAADDLQMLVTKLARRLELAERKLIRSWMWWTGLWSRRPAAASDDRRARISIGNLFPPPS